MEKVYNSQKNTCLKFILSFLFLIAFSHYGFGQGATCATAQAITINGACDGPTSITDTTNDLSLVSSCEAFNREGWYSFLVSGGPLDITITGTDTSNRNMALALYSGACTSLTELSCADAFNSNTETETISFNGLSNGTYYIRVIYSNSNTNAFSLCVTSVTTPSPSNDICTGATSLTVNTGSTCTISLNGTTIGATFDSGTGVCLTGTENAVWYSFVATATYHEITVDGAAGFNPVIKALSACGTNTVPTGGTCVNATVDDGVETMALSGLTPGNTYFMQVHDFNGDNNYASTFNICVTTPPIPCNAPTVTAATSVGGTTATINWTAAAPVPSNGYEYIVSTDNSTATPANDITGSTVATSAGISGLSATTTYYVFVRSNCGSSTYSSWSGPVTFTTSIANNLPCGAISIPVNTSCSTTAGTNVGATDSGVTAPSGSGACGNTSGSYAGGDVWFSLTIPANGSVQLDVFTGTLTDPVVAAYTAPSCGGTYTFVGCDDDGGSGLESQLQLSGLTPGNILYIRVWRYSGGGAGTFSICATSPSTTPPANDLCTDATTLSCGDSDIPGTTSGASNINPGVGCTMSNYGVWYTFIGDGNLSTITVIPDSGYDIELSVSSGNCGGLTSVACIDSSGSGSLESYSFVTTNSTRYYAYVASTYSGATAFDTGGFTISRSCQTVTPPSNDNCSGAINMVVNGSCVETSGTTLYATPSTGVSAPTCGSYSGGDVWYTVTVPPTASLTITTQTGTANDINLAAYSGTCGGTLTQLSGTSCTSGTSLVLSAGPNGIVPGQLLYIRVWEAGNNQNGTFTICATSLVPPGTNGAQLCAGSSSSPLTTDLFCNVGGVSVVSRPDFSGNLNGSSSPHALTPFWLIDSTDPCAFDPSRNYAYDIIEFVCNVTGTYVFSANASWDTLGYITQVPFTPGNCGSGVYIAGDDDSGPGLLSEITATLVQGQNYYLITTNALGGSNLVGSYSWTTDVTPASAEWYDASSGGNVVGYGAFFDPVASGLVDINTPGTYTYWAGCPGSSDPREQAVLTINIIPESTITSGTPAGCNSFDITVQVNDPLGTQWYATYAINGSGSYPINGTGFTSSNPFTFTVNDIDAPAGSVITINYLANTSTFCAANSFIGNTTTSYNCACKTWNGLINDNWTTAGNWTPSGAPTSSDCVIIPNITNPSAFDPFIFGGTNATALDITILSGGFLTILPNANLTVQNEVDINTGGTLELQSQNGAADGTSSSLSGSLIQVNNVTNTVNGTFRLYRAAYVRTRDYVYWSSPVQNFAVGGIATTPNKYKWIPTVPANVPTGFGEWQQTNENMVAGKGYIVRGPVGNGNTDTTASWNTILFSGAPHNGTIQLPMVRGTYTAGNVGNPSPGQADITKDDDNWNLVGNPYPSTLDADLFLSTNTTANKISGTMWLWTHVTRIGQGNQNNPFYGSYVYNYDEADYMSYNGTASNPPGWSGNIGSGQGFFVLMSDALTTSENLEFNNSMRTTGTEQFLRTSASTEKHRIWVDLVSLETNQVSTIAIGYVEGATNEFDNLYDAPLFSGSTAKIFMPITTEERILSIQGRQLPFDINDQIPISVIIDQLGTYGLGVQHYDGLFDYDNQEVFIKDLELGITHNIKESPYYFTASTTGVISDRFVVVYTDNSLSSEDFNLNSLSISAPGSDYIKVSSKNEMIDSVVVYDLLGRVLIDNKDINAQEFVINEIPKAGGAYIVKATLLNGQEKIQKVVLK